MAHKSISILPVRTSELVAVAQQMKGNRPHKPIQPKLPAPFAKLVDPFPLAVSPIRLNFSPKYDILSVHGTTIHLRSAASIEVEHFERTCHN